MDMFGEGQDGLQFVMDHTWLCGLVVVAGGAATFCRLYLIETAIERIAFRLRREFFSALIHRQKKCLEFRIVYVIRMCRRASESSLCAGLEMIFH